MSQPAQPDDDVDPWHRNSASGLFATIWDKRAAMGITRVADLTGLDVIGMPVYAAYRPNSRGLAVSQGKGLSHAQARLAAVMEAVEGYHGEHIERPLRLASYAELAGSLPLLDPASLPRLGHGAYRPNWRMLWIEGREVVTGAAIWLPFECVHSDACLPQPAGAGCFPVSTNGLGAGADGTAARWTALLEVIERDALSLWQYRPRHARARRRINLRTVRHAGLRQLIDTLAQAGFAVALDDMSSDLPVACVQAVIAPKAPERRGISPQPGLGQAAHPDPERACLKALCEAVQVRTTYIAGARDDLEPGAFSQAGLQDSQRRALQLIETVSSGRSIDALPRANVTDAADLAAALNGLGLGPTIAVDLAKPALGIAVERVIVPGLEAPHDTAGYCPRQRALALAAAGEDA